MRRIAAWFAVAVGVMLIGFTFGEHLVSRSRDAQKIADYYQPLMSESVPFDATTDQGSHATGTMETHATVKAEGSLVSIELDRQLVLHFTAGAASTSSPARVRRPPAPAARPCCARLGARKQSLYGG